jgi:single-strand DNA-binding protein
MPNSSTWIGIGHLGKDAEVRDAGQHKVVSFSVAVTRKRQGNESTTWFRCQWFGDRAVRVVQFLTKGKAVQVVGELYEDTYEKDGAEKRSLKVDVRDVTLLGGGEKNGAAQAPAARPAPAPAASGGGSDSDPPFQRRGEFE